MGEVRSRERGFWITEPMQPSDPETVNSSENVIQQGSPLAGETTLISARISNGALDRLDGVVDAGAYPNRSEAVRAAIADLIAHHQAEDRQIVTDGGTVFADADSTPQFVTTDERGRYVRCTEFRIDEKDRGSVCGGKQRPHPTTDGKRRYVCSDCGAATTQAYADGGGR